MTWMSTSTGSYLSEEEIRMRCVEVAQRVLSSFPANDIVAYAAILAEYVMGEEEDVEEEGDQSEDEGGAR